ncbi:MAG TPA: SDR family NAD(P)-dependent oxidoreductase [Gaiellaceae bacterium]|nr:SDR family NAD(P)-dependent oxidoreductase [Gaiellaceae bacterium]
MDTGLAGKTAVVTGAASGIGLACSQAFAREGATAVVADIDGGAAELAAAALGGHAVEVDVSRPADARRLVADATRLTGRLDVVVAGAGIFSDAGIDSVSPEDWDRVQSVNLRGAYLVVQAALAEMVPRRRGRIVLIASLAGQVGGLAAGVAYAASKGGVLALTKAAARYGGPHGITVNCVSPGLIETPMTAGWPAAARERVVAGTPLGRLGTADEVAAAIVWLASDGASFVHGARLDVNGGLHME